MEQVLHLQFPDDSLDKADDLGFRAVDGVIIFIFGHEPNFAVPAVQTLDSCLVSDAGNHDLAVIGVGLGRTTTMSPSRIAAFIILSPRTRRAKHLGSPSQAIVPSWFSSARMGRPAVTTPTTGI